MFERESFLPTIRPEAAPYALEAIDEVVHLYMEARNVNRRILSVPESELMKPQENIAEHMLSAVWAAQTLWENRKELNIKFGRKFDIGVTIDGLSIHDVGEVKSPIGDVDAMCRDELVLLAKADHEIDAFERIGRESKYLGWLANRGVSYEKRERPEYKFGSDIEKHVGTQIIFHYARWRWWGFAGEITTREDHTRIMRQKLATPLGHEIFTAMEAKFDERDAELRNNEGKKLGLFPDDIALAKAMRTSDLHKMLIGYKRWPERDTA